MFSMSHWRRELAAWDEAWQHPEGLSETQVDLLMRGLCFLTQQCLLRNPAVPEGQEILGGFHEKYAQVQGKMGLAWLAEHSDVLATHGCPPVLGG